MANFSVYLLTNTGNHKMYVGQTKKAVMRRWSGHRADATRGKDTALTRAIRKHSANAFQVQILAQVDTKSEADNLERVFIILFQTQNSSKGYNCTAGGDTYPDFVGSRNPFYGKKHTEETRRKIASSRLGKKNTLESNEKRRIASTRIYRQGGALLQFNISGAGHKPKSLETRAKMGAWQVGRKLPKETKLKIGLANRRIRGGI